MASHRLEGFTDWDGGANPVPGQSVRVVFGGSNVPAKPVYPSEKLDWAHHGGGIGGDIVAYQVVDAAALIAP